MSRLTWDDVGERLYETGIDRGVLYVDGFDGVAWNGLTSLDENPTGGEARAYYVDGIKYQNISSVEEFEGTINAFYSPAEFDACDGLGAVKVGLYISQQPRKSFGLSYRTKIGNDVNGIDHAYKIHFIYNALAGPPQKEYSTISDRVNLTPLSWNITTKPVLINQMKQSAHVILDTSKILQSILTKIEKILYGSDSESARLPLPYELIAIIEEHDTFFVVDNGDGTFTVSGSDEFVGMIDDFTFEITNDGAIFIDAVSYTITSDE